MTFSLLPSGLRLSPRSVGVLRGSDESFLVCVCMCVCVCVIWTSMGSMCNCQEYQSQFESVTVVNAYLFSVLSPCPERIGMCINSFKSYVKYSHKVE